MRNILLGLIAALLASCAMAGESEPKKEAAPAVEPKKEVAPAPKAEEPKVAPAKAEEPKKEEPKKEDAKVAPVSGTAVVASSTKASWRSGKNILIAVVAIVVVALGVLGVRKLLKSRRQLRSVKKLIKDGNTFVTAKGIKLEDSAKIQQIVDFVKAHPDYAELTKKFDGKLNEMIKCTVVCRDDV